MRNLLEIWEEALSSPSSVRVNCPCSEGALQMGVKIIKVDNRIIILNTHKGGDYYAEIEPHEYMVFLLYGWTAGVLNVAMGNAVRKIEKYKLIVIKQKGDKYEKIKEATNYQMSKVKSLRIKIKSNYGREHF